LSAQAPLAIAVAGASGRMGRMLIEAVLRADDCRLAGALDVPGSPALGQDAAAFLGHASGAQVTSDIRQGLSSARVLVDFTRPEGTLAHLTLCRELGVAAVVGTTGFEAAQKAQITQIAQ
jgi:4-hydroxy-tetrahydrodipicolinate reductase